MADQRTLVTGQVVNVDVPSTVRNLLPVSNFTVSATDQSGVHLRASSPFGDGLSVGTPAVVSSLHSHWPLEGLIVEVNAPNEIVVVLEAVPERRQYERAEFALEGELQLIDHPGSFPSRFTTVDVSAGGVCMRLTGQVQRGDRGFVSLEVGGSPVLAVGEILDCHAVNMYFEARLRFTSIAEPSRDRLARMVSQANEALNASA